MYKKITHHIVEEHFDHPIGGQIKKSVDKKHTMVNDEIFSESQFRSDAHEYFTAYLSNLISLINSVTGTQEDSVVPFERVFNNAWVDNLGNMTNPFYPMVLGEGINETMRRMMLNTFFQVNNVKTGAETQFLINSWKNVIASEAGQILAAYNSDWLFLPVQNLFISIGDEVIALMKARAKKDVAAEKLALTNLSSSFASFEKLFVDGIISKHPDRFKATMIDHHDIM